MLQRQYTLLSKLNENSAARRDLCRKVKSAHRNNVPNTDIFINFSQRDD